MADDRIPVPEEAVDAALAADTAYHGTARETVWASPSRAQVRAMLEAAAPLIRQDERKRLLDADRDLIAVGAWPLLDPDCRDGKCGSCVGPPCEHECHKTSSDKEGGRPC